MRFSTVPSGLIATLILGIVSGFDRPADAESPVVSIETNRGTIVAELDAENSPVTVENFLQYARDGFYDDTVFHRVIPAFMIQGGGRDANLKKKPTRAAIKNEAANGLKNDPYTLAMARTGDPDSATSQFFINTNANDNLNRPSPDGHGYAVFGKVIEGTEVVDAIEQVETGKHPDPDFPGLMMSDVPTEIIKIESVTILSGDPKEPSDAPETIDAVQD